MPDFTWKDFIDPLGIAIGSHLAVLLALVILRISGLLFHTTFLVLFWVTFGSLISLVLKLWKRERDWLSEMYDHGRNGT